MSVELFLSQASDLRPHFTIPAVARSHGHPDEIARALVRVTEEAIEEELERQGFRGETVSLRASVLFPGIANPRFGGGRQTFPMRMSLVGQGPLIADAKRGELEDVAWRACSHWVKSHLRFVEPSRDVALDLTLRCAGAVRSAFLSIARAPLAGSQYFAQEVVALVTSNEFRRTFPEAGDEAEASALASSGLLRIDLNLPLLDRFVHSERSYFSRKLEIESYINEKLTTLPPEFDRMQLRMNPEDVAGRGEAGLLLTLLGTTADTRRPGLADGAPEGETTSPIAADFARTIVSRIRGVRAAVVRLEEDDRAEVRRAFVRLELLPGVTIDDVRPAVNELVPLRTRPARSMDPEFFQGGDMQ